MLCNALQCSAMLCNALQCSPMLMATPSNRTTDRCVGAKGQLLLGQSAASAVHLPRAQCAQGCTVISSLSCLAGILAPFVSNVYTWDCWRHVFRVLALCSCEGVQNRKDSSACFRLLGNPRAILSFEATPRLPEHPASNLKHGLT